MSKAWKGRKARRPAALGLALVAGFAVALMAGIAGAHTFTLNVRKNVHVTNITKSPAVDKHEAVVTGPAGYALYTLKGETTAHLKCTTSGCLSFWPPASVKSAKGLSVASGIKGKLGTFHRGKFGLQLELNGHPLYYFSLDLKGGNKNNASGDLVQNQGTWYVLTPDPSSRSTSTSTTSGTTTGYTTTTTTTTTTSPIPYGY